MEWEVRAEQGERRTGRHSKDTVRWASSLSLSRPSPQSCSSRLQPVHADRPVLTEHSQARISIHFCRCSTSQLPRVSERGSGAGRERWKEGKKVSGKQEKGNRGSRSDRFAGLALSPFPTPAAAASVPDAVAVARRITKGQEKRIRPVLRQLELSFSSPTLAFDSSSDFSYSLLTFRSGGLLFLLQSCARIVRKKAAQ